MEERCGTEEMSCRVEWIGLVVSLMPAAHQWKSAANPTPYRGRSQSSSGISASVARMIAGAAYNNHGNKTTVHKAVSRPAREAPTRWRCRLDLQSGMLLKAYENAAVGRSAV